MATYTRADVARHCTADDLWVYVAHGGVYKVLDLTEFATRHPGGLEALLEVAGQDATERILEVHPKVLDGIDTLCIGTL